MWRPEEVKMTWPKSHRQEMVAILLGWGCYTRLLVLSTSGQHPEASWWSRSGADSEEAPVGNLTQSWPRPVLRQARVSCLPLHQVSDSTIGKKHFFRYKTGLLHSSYLRQLRKTDAQARSHTRARSHRAPAIYSTCPPHGRLGHWVSISSTSRLASDNLFECGADQQSDDRWLGNWNTAYTLKERWSSPPKEEGFGARPGGSSLSS